MVRPVHSVLEWQVLRILARAAPGSVVGRELRLDMSRRTKDGTFLDEMVRVGLIEVAEAPAPQPVSLTRRIYSKPEPKQFRVLYRLTAMGRHAAEYGEYTARDPNPIPVRNARPATRKSR